MTTKLEIRFIAKSPKKQPTYQTRCWFFPNKKDAKKFVKTAYLSDYLIDKVLFITLNKSKMCFRNELK